MLLYERQRERDRVYFDFSVCFKSELHIKVYCNCAVLA